MNCVFKLDIRITSHCNRPQPYGTPLQVTVSLIITCNESAMNSLCSNVRTYTVYDICMYKRLHTFRLVTCIQIFLYPFSTCMRVFFYIIVLMVRITRSKKIFSNCVMICMHHFLRTNFVLFVRLFSTFFSHKK